MFIVGMIVGVTVSWIMTSYIYRNVNDGKVIIHEDYWK